MAKASTLARVSKSRSGDVVVLTLNPGDSEKLTIKPAPLHDWSYFLTATSDGPTLASGNMGSSLVAIDGGAKAPGSATRSLVLNGLERRPWIKYGDTSHQLTAPAVTFTVLLDNKWTDFYLTNFNFLTFTYTQNGTTATESYTVLQAGRDSLSAPVNAAESYLIVGGAAGATMNGGAAGDLILGGGGNDLINGNGGNDTLNGGGGADTLNGGDGDDSLVFGFEDLIDGGDGNDTLLLSGARSDYVIVGNDDGSYSIFGTGANASRKATIRNIELVQFKNDTSPLPLYPATSNADSISAASEYQAVWISGLDGKDTLVGSDFNDTLRGDGGDDLLVGGAGSDSLSGGSGNDLLLGGTGADTLDGGDGTDTASFADAGGGVSVNLLLGTATHLEGGATETDRLISIENVIGSAYGDTLVGNSLDNILDGDLGNDSLDGGAGNDTLLGGAGNDTFVFGNGDSIDGGADIDTLVFGGLSSQFSITFNADDGSYTISRTVKGQTQSVRVRNIEYIQFGDSAIPLQLRLGSNGFNRFGVLGGTPSLMAGFAGADSLFGGTSGDLLLGGDGNDLLDGKGGNDTLDGGAGIDTASFDYASAGMTIDLAAGMAGVYSGGKWVERDVLRSIENVVGTNYNDSIRGDGNDNVIWGNGGSDTIDGGGGNDTVFYRGKTSDFGFSYANGKLIVTHGTDRDVLTNVEHLQFGDGTVYSLVAPGGSNTVTGGPVVVLGTAAGESLAGGTENDILLAGGGGDTLDGGAGNDTAYLSDYIQNYTFESSIADGIQALSLKHGKDTLSLRNIETVVFKGVRYTLGAIGQPGANGLLVGSSDNDVATFAGKFSDYLVELGPISGTFYVRGSDGSLTALYGYEALQFSDSLYNVAALSGSPGGHSLVWNTGSGGTTVTLDGTGGAYCGGGGWDKVAIAGSKDDYAITYDLKGARVAMVLTRKADGAVTVLTRIDEYWFTNDPGTHHTIQLGTSGNDTLGLYKSGAITYAYEFVVGGAGQNTIAQGDAQNFKNPYPIWNVAAYVGTLSSYTIGRNWIGQYTVKGLGSDDLFGQMHVLRFADGDWNLVNAADGWAHYTKIDFDTRMNNLYVAPSDVALIETTAGSGNDWIMGSNVADTILGGDGNDTLFGGGGDDWLDGGTGTNSIDGGDGADTILGLKGDDTLLGGGGDDWLDGGTGTNSIDGGAGTDTVRLHGKFTDYAVKWANGKLVFSRADGSEVTTVDHVEYVQFDDFRCSIGGVPTGNDGWIDTPQDSATVKGTASPDVFLLPAMAPASGPYDIDGGAGPNDYVSVDAARSRAGFVLTSTGLTLTIDGHDLANLHGFESVRFSDGKVVNLIDASHPARAYDHMVVKGTDQDDLIIGDDNPSSIHESIVGGAGDDTIYGRGSADNLSGGDGSDLFVFRLDHNAHSAIQDFDTAHDKILLIGPSSRHDLSIYQHAGYFDLIYKDGHGHTTQLNVSGVATNLESFITFEPGPTNLWPS